MSETLGRCAHCGKLHEGLPLVFGFRLPDEVHALDYIERYRRSRHNADLCTLDEARFFIRGTVGLPLAHLDDSFCWGVWVEVDRLHHDAHAASFDENLPEAPRFQARLANDIPGLGGTLGLPVEVEFGSDGDRPSFFFPADATHPLAIDQREGLSAQRHHELLDATGYFKDAPRETPSAPPALASDGWPFEASHDTTCYVDRRILEGRRSILHFIREPAGDMGQSVYHAMTGDALEDSTVIAIVGLDHVLSLDAGLAELARLPVGWEAVRASTDAPWVSQPIPEDDDEA